MANYTISQCLELQGLDEEVKSYLEKLSKSGLPTLKDKVFMAASKAQLKELLNAEYEKVKERNADYKECISIIDSLVKGTQKQKRLISATELLPRLKELKEQIESEKRFAKVDDFISKSGMTKEQIIEYLNK